MNLKKQINMRKKDIIISEQQFMDLLSNFFKKILGGGDSNDDTDDSQESSNNPETSKITNTNDEDFYKKLLQKLGAKTTDENLKFLYAWRQSEGKSGKYNPFNTTQSMPGSTNFNSVGVKNYASIDDGLNATIKTLNNGRYNCIVNGLKNSIGAKKITQDCSNELKTWGTGDLVAKVISGYDRGASPKISSLA
jgi:hypothetical protein